MSLFEGCNSSLSYSLRKQMDKCNASYINGYSVNIGSSIISFINIKGDSTKYQYFDCGPTSKLEAPNLKKKTP